MSNAITTNRGDVFVLHPGIACEVGVCFRPHNDQYRANVAWLTTDEAMKLSLAIADMANTLNNLHGKTT